MPNEPNLLMNYGLELVQFRRAGRHLERYWDAFHLMAELPVRQVTPELRENPSLTQLTTQFDGEKRTLPGSSQALASFHSPNPRG